MLMNSLSFEKKIYKEYISDYLNDFIFKYSNLSKKIVDLI